MLQDIVRHKIEELAQRRRQRPLRALTEGRLFELPRRDFAAALTAPGRRIVAEVKRASPSRGRIREDFRPVALAEGYAEAGAAAISVLTDERFFEGSLDHLVAIRERVEIPLLRKDFLVEPYHVYEARAAGADAFLLIAAILDVESLRELMAVGRELGMAAVVEVHDRPQLERALAVDAKIVGINNRDLNTFETRLTIGLDLVREIPSGRTIVIESGLKAPSDLLPFEAVGVRAFLIGETFMSAPDPAGRLREFLA